MKRTSSNELANQIEYLLNLSNGASTTTFTNDLADTTMEHDEENGVDKVIQLLQKKGPSTHYPEKTIPRLDFLTRKLGGFRNIGWTIEHKTTETNETFHQALVYSLRTCQTFPSGWFPNEEEALRCALLKSCGTEAREQHGDLATKCLDSSQSIMTTPSSKSPCRSPSSSRNDILYDFDNSKYVHSQMNETYVDNTPHHHSSSNNNNRMSKSLITKLPGTSKTLVMVWCSYLPDPSQLANEVAFRLLTELLECQYKLLSVIRLPNVPHGVLIFDCLPSAIDFLRNAKSRQLEYFDNLVAGDWPSKSPRASQATVLIDPESRHAVGFSLVNVSPQHPTCLHTLLRLSQHDAVALGHKRSSTETLRLLLTHPEVAPLMTVPELRNSLIISRATPVSQTPSHRRAGIWCALCCSKAIDIPCAWKHVNKSSHAALRHERNAYLMKWIATKDPALAACLMDDGPSIFEAPIQETTKIGKHGKGSRQKAGSIVAASSPLAKNWKTPMATKAIANDSMILTPSSSRVGGSGLNPNATPFFPAIKAHATMKNQTSVEQTPLDFRPAIQASLADTEAYQLTEWAAREKRLSPKQNGVSEEVATTKETLSSGQQSSNDSFFNQKGTSYSRGGRTNSSLVAAAVNHALDVTPPELHGTEIATILESLCNRAAGRDDRIVSELCSLMFQKESLDAKASSQVLKDESLDAASYCNPSNLLLEGDEWQQIIQTSSLKDLTNKKSFRRGNYFEYSGFSSKAKDLTGLEQHLSPSFI